MGPGIRTITVALCFSFFRSIAQTPDSGLNADMHQLENFQTHRPPILFLSLDKQIYNTNENIMFTAFALDRGFDRRPATVLHLALIDYARGITVAADQFLFTGGLGTGSLLVPDTLASGDYLFMAYTAGTVLNPLGRPFRQAVTIMSGEKPPFRLINAAVFPVEDRSDSIHWRAKVVTSYNGIAAGGSFRYIIRSEGRLLITGTKKIDAFGEVDLVLPARDSSLNRIYLWALVSRIQNKVADSCQVYSSICLTPDRIKIGFYPESGVLINGHLTRLGISLLKGNESGMATHVTLYEDSTAVAGAQTDLYGLGNLLFIPRLNKHYSVRLDNQPGNSYLVGDFPTIAQEGVTLRLPSCIVSDSMVLTIETSQPGASYNLLVFSSSDVIYAGVVNTKKTASNAILDGAGWPRGLAKIVLFSTTNSPVAERTIYIAPRKIDAVIQTDSSSYHSRSLVRVKITLSDDKGMPVRGVLSFTSSMATRFHRSRVPYITLEPIEGTYDGNVALPKPPGGYLDGRRALDLYLLTRMSNYLPWTAISGDGMPNVISDSGDNYGYVLYKGRNIKRSIKLLLMGSKIALMATDSSGRFEVPDSCLIAPLGADPVLSVFGTSDQSDYRIVSCNRNDAIATDLAAVTYPSAEIKPDTVLEEVEEQSDRFARVKMLKEAVVRNGGDDDDIRPVKSPCPDYVCYNNVLNCSVHTADRTHKPVRGKTYRYFGQLYGQQATNTVMGTIIYSECISCRACGPADTNAFARKLPGIHLPFEFYNADSIKFVAGQPAIYTTLFWMPFVITDTKGQAEFHFYTNDVPGRFYNLIQGNSVVGPFRASSFFSVSGPSN